MLPFLISAIKLKVTEVTLHIDLLFLKCLHFIVTMVSVDSPIISTFGLYAAGQSLILGFGMFLLLFGGGCCVFFRGWGWGGLRDIISWCLY